MSKDEQKEYWAVQRARQMVCSGLVSQPMVATREISRSFTGLSSLLSWKIKVHRFRILDLSRRKGLYELVIPVVLERSSATASYHAADARIVTLTAFILAAADRVQAEAPDQLRQSL
jgi:hypothetical protein